MRYFGIKIPKTKTDESYVWWISDSIERSWSMFFSSANKYGEVYTPFGQVKREYEKIGYECIELIIKEK